MVGNAGPCAAALAMPTPPQLDEPAFHKEMRCRLAAMDRKLDKLSAHMGMNVDFLHSPQKLQPHSTWGQWTLQESPRRRAISSDMGLATRASTACSPSGFALQASTQSPQGGLREARMSSRNSSHAGAEQQGNRVSVRTDGSLQIEEDRFGIARARTSSWLEKAANLNKKKRLNPVLARIWRFLEDSESSRCAHWYAVIMPIFTLSTVAVTLLQTMERPIFNREVAAVLETSFDSVFALELLLRLATCPSHRAFFFSPYNLIDVFAVAPLGLRAAIGFKLPQEETIASSILLCFVPLIRLLKTLRRFKKIQLLVDAFALSLEALPVLMYTAFIMNLAFSALIYVIEPRDNMPTFTSAMWLTVVTMTTVGYGDTTPTTDAGTLVVSVLIISSVLYMSIPLGIVGQIFGKVWEQRDRILLMQTTRQRLLQWGYTAHDIPMLFDVFDSDGDGELTLQDFRRMIHHLDIGMSEERTSRLFDAFDNDGGGSISDAEFVKFLFPREYYDLFVATGQDHAASPPSDCPPSDPVEEGAGDSLPPQRQRSGSLSPRRQRRESSILRGKRMAIVVQRRHDTAQPSIEVLRRSGVNSPRDEASNGSGSFLYRESNRS